MMNDHEIIDSALDRERITPPVFTLAILGMIIFLCLLLGLGMVESYGYFKGMNVTEALANLTADSSTSIRDFIRTNLLINHLTTFVFPALVFSYFFYKSKWTSFLNINKIPIVANLILGGVLIIAAFPLAQLAFWINMNIPMPNFLVEMEEGTSEMVRNLLLAEQPHELWFNLLTIAGEELIFRGILQKKLDEQLKNPHLAIWLAALIFSAIHMQFQGFLSRMLLGGILGYMYHWTGNLWVPIFAHLVNNAVQIIGQYFFQKGMIETNIDRAILDVNWVMTLVAFAVVGVLSFAMKKLNDRNQEELTI
jgi:membrane protease YdiL (CAAX protease family)